MSDLVVRVLAILAGCALALQPPINARLRIALMDPVWASLVSFIVGALALLAIAVVMRTPFPGFGLAARSMPWWGWTGGLFGVVYVMLALVIVPRIGATALLSLVVLGMMLAGLAIDQSGILGVAVRQLSLLRIVGAVCVFAGVVFISR